MSSPIALERSGRWRAVFVMLLLFAVALPILPLVPTTLSTEEGSPFWVGRAFLFALTNSTLVAVLVGLLSFVVGLPCGLLVALYSFPGRKVLLALATLPLLVPSFLWAIGWSSLALRVGHDVPALLTGTSGCVLVLLPSTTALVLLSAYAASASLRGSAIDAARLSGGEKAVLLYTARFVALPSLLAAELGGVFTLSDPGPGQILGLRTVASEILTSFSALYDFALAGRQCLFLTALVLLVSLPLATAASPRIANELLAKGTKPLQTIRHPGVSRAATLLLVGVVLLGTALPLTGLTLPLVRGAHFTRAWDEVARTITSTLFYSVGAGVVAATLGVLVAGGVARECRLRVFCLAACLSLFSVPPALTALGLVQLGTDAPPSLDFLFRSRFTLCLALGVRFFPVCALLSLRAWSSMPASWALAAGVHHVSLRAYLLKVLIPHLLPAWGTGVLLVGLLATADVGTVLLLHPPGEASFPLAIFTVMANAPEALVASLCLFYVLGAGLFLGGGAVLFRRRAG